VRGGSGGQQLGPRHHPRLVLEELAHACMVRAGPRLVTRPARDLWMNDSLEDPSHWVTRILRRRAGGSRLRRGRGGRA
jgi:hypothetical protein